MFVLTEQVQLAGVYLASVYLGLAVILWSFGSLGRVILINGSSVCSFLRRESRLFPLAPVFDA